VIVRAGAFFDRSCSTATTRHRPTQPIRTVGWPIRPWPGARGEQQLGTFLSTGQVVNTNPSWLEFPIANPNNLECLHYADPQTGQTAMRQPFPASGDCPPPF
jgi:hypothetical protein